MNLRGFDDLTRILAYAFARRRPHIKACPSQTITWTPAESFSGNQPSIPAVCACDPTDIPKANTKRAAAMPQDTDNPPRTRTRVDPVVAGPALLTARELEVATLVARGLKNREIAAALVVSDRTVHAHVRSILDKLGVSSRTQIAVWITAHRPSALTLRDSTEPTRPS